MKLKLAVIILAALIGPACAPLRAVKQLATPSVPSAECARRTLLIRLHLDCPRAFWALEGNTWVAQCEPGAKAAWVAPDPVWRDCQK